MESWPLKEWMSPIVRLTSPSLPLKGRRRPLEKGALSLLLKEEGRSNADD
jgi:hypothetical protein